MCWLNRLLLIYLDFVTLKEYIGFKEVQRLIYDVIVVICAITRQRETFHQLSEDYVCPSVLTCFGGGSLELGPEGKESHVGQKTIAVRVELGMVGLR